MGGEEAQARVGDFLITREMAKLSNSDWEEQIQQIQLGKQNKILQE